MPMETQRMIDEGLPDFAGKLVIVQLPAEGHS